MSKAAAVDHHAGCDGASAITYRTVFPFTALERGDGSRCSDGDGGDVARLCLATTPQTNLRVLRREENPHRHWCVAQTESGRVGLVPLALVRRWESSWGAECKYFCPKWDRYRSAEEEAEEEQREAARRRQQAEEACVASTGKAVNRALTLDACSVSTDTTAADDADDNGFFMTSVALEEGGAGNQYARLAQYQFEAPPSPDVKKSKCVSFDLGDDPTVNVSSLSSMESSATDESGSDSGRSADSVSSASARSFDDGSAAAHTTRKSKPAQTRLARGEKKTARGRRRHNGRSGDGAPADDAAREQAAEEMLELQRRRRSTPGQRADSLNEHATRGAFLAAQAARQRQMEERRPSRAWRGAPEAAALLRQLEHTQRECAWLATVTPVLREASAAAAEAAEKAREAAEVQRQADADAAERRAKETAEAQRRLEELRALRRALEELPEFSLEAVQGKGSLKSRGTATAIFTERDANLPALNGAAKKEAGGVTARQDDRLEAILAEDLATLQSYQQQKQVLEGRRAQLQEWIAELRTESSTLKVSEKALSALVAPSDYTIANGDDAPESSSGGKGDAGDAASSVAQNTKRHARCSVVCLDDGCTSGQYGNSGEDNHDQESSTPSSPGAGQSEEPQFHVRMRADFCWPETMPGLTEEEAAVIGNYARLCQKYRGKRESILEEMRARAAKLQTTEASAVATAHMPQLVEMVRAANQERIARLRGVIDAGTAEVYRLREELSHVREFLHKYEPVAAKIAEQIEIGNRVLEQKREYLDRLSQGVPAS